MINDYPYSSLNTGRHTQIYVDIELKNKYNNLYLAAYLLNFYITTTL